MSSRKETEGRRGERCCGERTEENGGSEGRKVIRRQRELFEEEREREMGGKACRNRGVNPPCVWPGLIYANIITSEISLADNQRV